MSRYFTSDLHLNSSEINRYCHRPWTSAEDARLALLAELNKLKSSDTVIHVGDFMLSSADRHGKKVDRPDAAHLTKAAKLLELIRPKIFLLEGNHDSSNCEASAKSMMLDLNHYWRNVYVSHFPSDNPGYYGPHGSVSRLQIALCGHVHASWLYFYDAPRRVFNINVGVDVWNYKPVRDAELTDMLDTLFGRKDPSTRLDLSSGKKFYTTRKEHDAFLRISKWATQHAREERKAERYEKKGLTPEECERRRIAAMKAKGLI